jgi:hypothetical protein
VQHGGSARSVSILVVLTLSLGFAAGGCPDNTGSSDGVQTGTNAAGGSKAAPKPVGESKREQRTCGECHEEQVKFWAYGGHSAVTCMKCHDVQDDHVSSGAEPSVRGNGQCMECHNLVKGPEAEKMSEKEVFEHHLRAVEKKHVIQVKREKVRDRCVYCHDPHLGQ